MSLQSLTAKKFTELKKGRKEIMKALSEAGKAPDYSQKSSWYKIPEITKKVDTFYIYATEYIMGSFEEGSPDYATLDNAEMILGVAVEYQAHATVFADTTTFLHTTANAACGTRGSRQQKNYLTVALS